MRAGMHASLSVCLSLPVCLCACMCVHVHMCVICTCSCGCMHIVCMSMCVACMWKPKINTWYLPQLPSILFTVIVSETGTHRFCQTGWPKFQESTAFHPSLPQAWRLLQTQVDLSSFLCESWGFELRCTGSLLTEPSPLPSSRVLFLFFDSELTKPTGLKMSKLQDKHFRRIAKAGAVCGIWADIWFVLGTQDMCGQCGHQNLSMCT